MPLTIPEFQIQTRADVERFIRWCIFDAHLNFNPENSFRDYEYLDRPECPTFDSMQAITLDCVLAECLALEGDNCYGITLDLLREYATDQKPIYCPADLPNPCIQCNHTQAEHAAFDEGVTAGISEREPEECPYDENPLKEIWLIGHGVNYRSANATRPESQGAHAPPRVPAGALADV